MSSAAQNCWACGSGTVARRRRLLGQQTLDAYQRIGVQEEQLPSSLADGNHYVCNACFSEAEKFSKLHQEVTKLATSMREKVNLSGEIDIVVIPAEGSPSRHSQQTPGPQPSVSSQCSAHLKTTHIVRINYTAHENCCMGVTNYNLLIRFVRSSFYGMSCTYFLSILYT